MALQLPHVVAVVGAGVAAEQLLLLVLLQMFLKDVSHTADESTGLHRTAEQCRTVCLYVLHQVSSAWEHFPALWPVTASHLVGLLVH